MLQRCSFLGAGRPPTTEICRSHRRTSDDRLSLLPWPDSVISVCHPVTSGL